MSKLLIDRGLSVTYETIHLWVKNFGPVYAQAMRKKKGSAFKNKWHVDEMLVKIKGEIFWLWRLVDSEGEEIEVLLHRRRDARSAIRFLKKALKRLRSYHKVHRVLLRKSEQRCHKRLNNRAENSHQPTREKERQMRGFKIPRNTQSFLSSMGTFLNLLKVKRSGLCVKVYREKVQKALIVFEDIVATHPQSI